MLSCYPEISHEGEIHLLADAQMLYLVFAEATNFNHSLSIDWVCHAYYVYTRACII